MIKEVIAKNEERMKKTLSAAKSEFVSLRAGRATPALLDKVMVEYYGSLVPVNQVGNISVPEPRMILIQPWEKPMLHEIEKAITRSDLGLSPNNDGTVIRLNIPQLTEERRTDLVKTLNKRAEESKVSVRNIRRDANEAIKKLEKAKSITEDDAKKAQEDIQKIVDKYIKEIDSICEAKKKEIEKKFREAEKKILEREKAAEKA